MGWIYFPESAGSVSDSGTSSEQSAMSKSTRTARKSCKPELKTNCLMTPLSGMILQHSTGDPGMDVWILSMAGFPARTSRLPEKVQVFGESVQDCFSKSSGSFAKYNPDTSSWRTFQLCLDGEWELYSESFPRAGMMRCGTVCRRVPWVPLTGGTGSGYLPSPSVCGNYNRKGVSKTSGDGLATAVKSHGGTQTRQTYPTPTRPTGNNSGRLDEWGGSHNPDTFTTERNATRIHNSVTLY